MGAKIYNYGTVMFLVRFVLLNISLMCSFLFVNVVFFV